MSPEEFIKLIEENPKAQYVINGLDYAGYVRNIVEELDVFKKAYSLLIDEVSLERWLNDSQKDELFNTYLEKVRGK